MPIELLVTIMILSGVIGFFFFFYGMTEESKLALRWGLVLGVIFFISMMWLIIAGTGEYEIVSQKKLIIVTEKLGDSYHQFIDGSGGRIDVDVTFGQEFPTGSVVEETEINPVVGNIDWHPQSVYLYEVVDIPQPVPMGPFGK